MRVRVKKQVLIFIAAGTVVVAFIVLRWLPVGRMRADLSQQQAQLENLMRRGQVQEAELPKLKAQLAELNEELAAFDSKIPTDTQLGQFLGKVAALMDERQLTEQQIAPRDQIESKELVCIPVTMKCTGSLEKIRDFCRALQGMSRAVRIEDVKLVNDSQFSGQVRMETEAIIYYRKTG